MSAHRWHATGVELRGGRRVVVVEDRIDGEDVRVYFARGAWRRWEVGHGDKPAGVNLAAVARRYVARQEPVRESRG